MDEKTLKAVKKDGTEIVLDISEEAIEELCKFNGFPVVKHGDTIETACKCGCGGYKTRRVVGVAACDQHDLLCSPECPLRDGKKIGLWVSSEDNNEGVVPLSF